MKVTEYCELFLKEDEGTLLSAPKALEMKWDMSFELSLNSVFCKHGVGKWVSVLFIFNDGVPIEKQRELVKTLNTNINSVRLLLV